MTQTKVILLACGSFNPPTFMHLRMFELARDHLNRLGRYQVIGGIISPVHDNYGKKELISSTHRVALLRLALQDSDWIFLSDWEVNQTSWVRTRQVLQFHQNKLNMYTSELAGNKRHIENDAPSWVLHAQKHCGTSNCGVKVKLLCGADLLESFGTPGLWSDQDIENIIGDHGLAVITRAGTDPHRFIYESDILSKYQNNIEIITEWIANEVSSTKIRRSLRRGESVKYLLPAEIIDYIKNNGLYSSTIDNKYQLYANSSMALTPSPNDIIMSALDQPDLGNFTSPPPPPVAPPASVTDTTSPVRLGDDRSESKRPRPGHAVALRKVHSRGSRDCDLETVGEVTDEETRVEIQIAEDGTIKVISDKETTV